MRARALVETGALVAYHADAMSPVSRVLHRWRLGAGPTGIAVDDLRTLLESSIGFGARREVVR